MGCAAWLAWSEHNHADHVDTGFIRAEARRIGWLPLEDIKKSKDELVNELQSYEDKFEVWFKGKADPDAIKVWEEKMRPKYRMAYDRMLIMSAVCFDVYNDSEVCGLESKDLENKYDMRTPQFLSEFKREI